MKLENFKSKLKKTLQEIEFSETIAVIEVNYKFTPTAFKKEALSSGAGENSGLNN